MKKYLLKKSGKSLHNAKAPTPLREVISLMKYLLAYQTKSQMHLIREKIVLYAIAHSNEEAAKRFECHGSPPYLHTIYLYTPRVDIYQMKFS